MVRMVEERILMTYECVAGNAYCTESQCDVAASVIGGSPQPLIIALTAGERSDGIRNSNNVFRSQLEVYSRKHVINTIIYALPSIHCEAQLNRSRNACLNGEGVCCSSPAPVHNQLQWLRRTYLVSART